jgi:hypothetical protein
MTLLDMQRTLSRILTDKEFRAAFQAEPAAAAAAYRLDAVELASLAALPWSRISVQADMLAHNRLGLALKAFPLSGPLLDGPVHERLAEFCAQFPPRPVAGSAMLVEAERLADFALHLLATGRLDPPWLGDVVRYELTTTRLGVTVTGYPGVADPSALAGLVPVAGPGVAVLTFDYDVAALVAQLAAGTVPEGVRPADGPRRILFVKQGGAVRQYAVNAATAQVIGLCDGHTTVDELVERVATETGARGAVAEPAVRRVVTGLLRIGALAPRPAQES